MAAKTRRPAKSTGRPATSRKAKVTRAYVVRRLNRLVVLIQSISGRVQSKECNAPCVDRDLGKVEGGLSELRNEVQKVARTKGPRPLFEEC